MKMDFKFFLFIMAAVLVASIIAHFLIKEKQALNGKTYKGLMATPSVPASVDPANPNAVAAQAQAANNAAGGAGN